MIDVSHHINSAVEAVIIPSLNQFPCRPMNPRKPCKIIFFKNADLALVADWPKRAEAFGCPLAKEIKQYQI